jgi:hypothetical protein
VIGAPVAAYLVWFAVYGTTGDAPLGANLRRLPRYVAELAATAAGGVSGLGRWVGAVLVVAGLLAAAWRVRRVSPRLSPA